MRKFVRILLLSLSLPIVAAQAEPVVVETAAGDVSFKVELALTPDEQSTGLMHRRKLPEDAGMLFIYTKPSRVGFWMKNTLIPLDIIFIDGRNRIIHVHENAQPLSLKVISPDRPARAVLEINGGISRRKGIVVGARVRHPLLDASSTD
jgi:uncharacterized membrane protein (UPF0127 family)